MEPTMTKFSIKTAAAALAALTLATTFTAIGGEAQARPRFGVGLGIATGLLVGAAVASNSYYYAPGYRDCRYVERMDRWGNLRTIRVCDVAPY
jgi:anaerobic C4-dicarboxylate transporter